MTANQGDGNLPGHPSFFADALSLELAELGQLLSNLQATQIKEAVRLLHGSPRIFTSGAGRSGLALRMGAMRLMHLGLSVHVAGETTTPAIAEGDLLVVASASGATAGVLHAAQVARNRGARVLAITAQPMSELGSLADALITLPASTTDEYGSQASRQYAGSLFEQGLLLLLDAIFHGAWVAGGLPAADLMKRHANLD